jgi:ubiquinone biosynthesis protein COQ4
MEPQTYAGFDQQRSRKCAEQPKPSFYKATARWFAAVKSLVFMFALKKYRTYYGVKFLLVTEGKTFERSLAGFRATAVGAKLLQQRPDSWNFLNDRSMLQACPPGSLGRWYAEFMSGHGLNEDLYQGLAIENGARLETDPARVWFRTRIEASHDLRHVLTGYGPNMLGEICLLSFRFGQIRHWGTLALAIFGYMNLMFTSRGPVLDALIEAYQRGRHARMLDWLPWEHGLAQSLADHRAAFGLAPPKRYPNPFAPGAYANH